MSDNAEFFDRYASDLASTAAVHLGQENPRLHEIYREMFDIQDGFFDLDETKQTEFAARYDSLRDELITVLGEDVGVGLIDPWLFDIFSDCYKSDVGFRPRNHTYRQAKDYMANRKDEVA